MANTWGINVSWSTGTHQVMIEINCECAEWYPDERLKGKFDLDAIELAVNEWLNEHEDDKCPHCDAEFEGLFI